MAPKGAKSKDKDAGSTSTSASSSKKTGPSPSPSPSPAAGANANGSAPAKRSARLSPEDLPDLVVTFGGSGEPPDTSRDVHVEQLSVQFHGHELLKETTLHLSHGQRYGLVGLNGVGKSSLLNAIAARMVPIPRNIDVYSVHHPIAPSDTSALDAVLEVDEERLELEAEADRLGDLLGEEGLDDEEQNELADMLNEVSERLEALDASSAKARAAHILTGLGFDAAAQAKPTKDFSGGWRMRVALARALYISPALLVLDGPTAHLDMEGVIWLEQYLRRYKGILIIVSHSQDFLDNVTTQTILMRQQRLIPFGGNYSTYVQTRVELETNQQKRHEWETAQLEAMKNYVARFGHGSAKLARQAKSKQKLVDKMVRGGITEAVTFDKPIKIVFPPAGKLPPPVIQLQSVSFSYPNGKQIYHKLDFGADLDTRAVIVGRNGVGKTTLLKLILGELVPTDGMVRRHHALRVAKFSQHSADALNLEETPLEHVLREFPVDREGRPQSIESARSIVGKFGITGAVQTTKMKALSDGQRARVMFATIAEKCPHFICLDEPSNPIDAQTTESLADAICAWDGGVIVVSHDFALVSRIAKEIWIADGTGLQRYPGTIQEYKKQMQKDMGLDG